MMPAAVRGGALHGVRRRIVVRLAIFVAAFAFVVVLHALVRSFFVYRE